MRRSPMVRLTMAVDEFTRLFTDINAVFTPATPLQSRELFAGRITQIDEVATGIMEPGRHVILYGERGVGKTSLANIIGQLQIRIGDSAINPNTVRVTAVAGDTYRDIWQKILRRMTLPVETTLAGIGERKASGETAITNVLSDRASPDEVLALLQRLGLPYVFIIDEYDRIADARTKTQVADTVKVVSDNLPQVTIILVGVSRTIEELIGHHPSVHRCLKEVQMPRMDDEEMDEILVKGSNAFI